MYAGSTGVGEEFVCDEGLDLELSGLARPPRATSAISSRGTPINSTKNNNIKMKPTPIII
jgi:hypothetical protein